MLSRRIRWRSERAQVVVLSAVVLPVLLGMAAVAIDMGNLYIQKRNLQKTADASALAAAQDLTGTSCSYPSACNTKVGSTASEYSDANSGGSGGLHVCTNASDTNCYLVPYVDKNGVSHDDRVEVRIQRTVHTFFAGIVGASQVKVGARAVGTITSGPPPPFSFVALNNNDEKHTLVIRSSGKLRVNNTIYVNSKSDDDGFDVFGTGGNISAPQIKTFAGWEKKVGTSVTVGLPTDPACAFPTYSAAEYSPKQTLKTAINDTATTITVKEATVAVAKGDLIEVVTAGVANPEWMLVGDPVAGQPGTFNVTRGYFDTVAVAHKAGDHILLVTSTSDPNGAVKVTAPKTGPHCPLTGQPLIPDPFAGLIATPSMPTANCPTGTGQANAPLPCGGITAAACASGCTLDPGTYYGGICVGKTKSDKNGTYCDPTCPTGGTITVHLNPGVYVIAGGGFYVCGGNSLDAPNVLIYNTAGAGGKNPAANLGPVHIETSGSATLGPMTSGPYRGLTVWQPSDQVLSNTNCDNRSPDLWDIALISPKPNGLSSISGTIYAPHPHALFGDQMSGTANLAVITGCIFIDGATSTFNFDSGGLFGVGYGLAE